MVRVFLVVVLSLPISCFAQDATPFTNVKIADVIAGLKKQEAAMGTLRVTLRARKISNFGMLFGGGDILRSSFTEEWHTDTTGKGWNHATGSKVQISKDGKRKEWEFDHHAAFDGELGTSLTIKERPTGAKNRDGSVGKAFMRYALPPGDFTFAHQGTLVSKSLESGGYKIAGTETWEDRSVLVLETPESNSNGSFYKAQFWVDPSREFLIVSRRNLSKSKEEAPWLAHFVVNSKKHKKYADSVWLPDVVETRSFVAPKKPGGEPTTIDRLDAACSNWQINEPIAPERLGIKFPKGLKVHGADQFPIEYQDVKRLGSFVAKIKTPLQKARLRSRNATAYAVVDATSFANANDRKITPTDFDANAFTQQLKKALGGPNETLMLRIEFGELGTEDTMQTFIQEPLKAYAKSVGFKNVRVTSSFGGAGREFRAPDSLPETSDEAELGNGNWSIYAVGTPLSRYLVGDAQVLITSKKHIPLETVELLNADDVKQIAAALDGHAIEGQKLNIKFTIGDQNSDPKNAEKMEVTQQSSDIQRDAVTKLRELGFGDIVLTVTISYSSHTSGYKQ